MKLLLDTCSFLWIIFDDAKLSETARKVFQEPANEVYMSSASAWEIAVKHSIGKLSLPEAPGELVPKQRNAHGITSLPLHENAALFVSRLPSIHHDPFDRMLISQALKDGMTLLTPDPLIQAYAVNTLW